MHTISLELLRHGPSNNQLLSPLTPYLALCQNHPAVTLAVPFEHGQMLHRLTALSYRQGDEPRRFQLQDTARALADLFGQVPGLTADMAGHEVGDDGNSYTQLRLVLSAAELALLPFELMLSPPGQPGAGQHLLLQAQRPICLTREIRRVTDDAVSWPVHPRILVVLASPPGLPAIPAEAHLLAIRQALDPWIAQSELDLPERQRDRVMRHLTVLSNASIRDIEQACAKTAYTHVHILAHGVNLPGEIDQSFGIALHAVSSPQGEMDKVSGKRLASALRATTAERQTANSRPSVVTMASCDSGHQGSVIGTGASVAHALHEAGIPLVIGSQFPLSYGASVRFVQTLYTGFLWGEDPRHLLVALRRSLHSEYPDTHDWASITAYAAFPPRFDKGLADAQIARAMAHIDVTLRFAGEAVWETSQQVNQQPIEKDEAAEPFETQSAPAPDGGIGFNMLSQARERVADAVTRLKGLTQRHPGEAARLHGYLASTEKRASEVCFLLSMDPRESELKHAATLRDEGWRALARARQYYWSAYSGNREDYWAVVQYLSLTFVLGVIGRAPQPLDEEWDDLPPLWWLAEVQSRQDQGTAGAKAIWAQANLLELHILAAMLPEIASQLSKHRRPNDRDPLRMKVQQLASGLQQMVGVDSFELFSTYRQLHRYALWGKMLQMDSIRRSADGAELHARFEQVIQLSKLAIGMLPEQEDVGWADRHT
ncbi:CHAT domain-containing protein [Chromobacterium violaceum]|uniref:CHAT domain-containing protein n=1 Tax=Chromobacterium violaceum TaxID=536 RepID=UPI003CF4BA7E